MGQLIYYFGVILVEKNLKRINYVVPTGNLEMFMQVYL